MYTINNKNFIAYYTDPYKEDCIAAFFKQHNFMSEETAKVSLKQIGCHVKILLEVGNGNHQKDFDEIRIVSKDNLEIIRFTGIYEQMHLGFGRMEIPFDLNTDLVKKLVELNLIKINKGCAK